MNKKYCLFLLLAISAVVVCPSCSSARSVNHLKIGVWASEKNLWDEAIFRWKKALLTDPRSVAAHNNLAIAYETKGLFDQALKEYETALKLGPDNAVVKSNYEKCKENIQPTAKKEPAGKKAKDEKK